MQSLPDTAPGTTDRMQAHVSTYVEQRLGRESPHARLRWTQQIARWSGHRQLVLPDGSADVVVYDDGAVRLVGPTVEPEVVELPADSTYRGLRLRPGGVRAVLGVPAEEVRGLILPLDDVVGRRVALELELAATGHPASAESLQLRHERSPQESRVMGVIGWLARNGGADLDQVMTMTGLSARQLRRLVLDHAGVGPKALQRVFRLQRFLHVAEQHSPGRRLADLAVELGYFDQAHLAREVKRLSGMTPTALLRHRAGS